MLLWQIPPGDRCTYPGICDFELSQDVLGHVVFSHGIHHKVLIAGRALCRPVLMTFLLQDEGTFFLFFLSLIKTAGSKLKGGTCSYPSHLSEFGQHYYYSGIVLP